MHAWSDWRDRPWLEPVPGVLHDVPWLSITNAGDGLPQVDYVSTCECGAERYRATAILPSGDAINLEYYGDDPAGIVKGGTVIEPGSVVALGDVPPASWSTT